MPMNNPTDNDSNQFPDAPVGSAAGPGSALNDALALVDFGACRDGDPVDWIKVAWPMCAHCIGAEDVNLATARIIAAEYRKIMAVLKDPAAVHANMLHGTIAWTPELLKHIIGDPVPNTHPQPTPTTSPPTDQDSQKFPDASRGSADGTCSDFNPPENK